MTKNNFKILFKHPRCSYDKSSSKKKFVIESDSELDNEEILKRAKNKSKVVKIDENDDSPSIEVHKRTPFTRRVAKGLFQEGGHSHRDGVSDGILPFISLSKNSLPTPLCH